MNGRLLSCLVLGSVMAQIGLSQGWSVNPHGTLLWGGQPYVPVGWRLEPGQIRELPTDAKDVLVAAPPDANGWTWVEELEKRKLSYLLEFSGVGPACTGTIVEPQSFRVDGLVGSKDLEFRLPGSLSILAVLALKRDASIQWKSVLKPDSDGYYRFTVDTKGPLESVLIVYPIGQSHTTVDCWEGFDTHRDTVLSTLKKSPIGPGLRGLVNPLGNNPNYPSDKTFFVPSSPLFRYELQRYLETTYRTFETAQRAWGLGSSQLDGFVGMSRLVPLWSGARGLQVLWDPEKNLYLSCTASTSRAWSDIRLVMKTALLRRAQSFLQAVKNVRNVPTIQTWSNDSPVFGGTVKGLEGLACTAAGPTVGFLARSVAETVSSGLAWPQKAWTVATDVRPPSFTPLDVASSVTELQSMGVRGFFLPWSVSNGAAKPFADVVLDGTATAWSPKVLLFPLAATNPAQVQRLPAGWVWLPSNFGGQRLDLGRDYRGYIHLGRESNFVALWRVSGSERTKLRHADPKSLTFETLDGSDANPKLIKNGVEVTLTEIPIIIRGSDEPPVPEKAIEETVSQFDLLVKLGERLKRDAFDERFYFREAYAAIERSPYGSFVTMRSRYWRMNLIMSPFTWIEAETARSTSIGEVLPDVGASNNAAIRISSPAVLASDPFWAQFLVPVRTTEDQDVWISAKFVGDQHHAIKISIGSQTLRLDPNPVAMYGNGYGWYRAGTTRLVGPSVTLRVDISPVEGLDLLIDAIMLAPSGIRPSGPWMPQIEVPAGSG